MYLPRLSFYTQMLQMLLFCHQKNLHLHRCNIFRKLTLLSKNYIIHLSLPYPSSQLHPSHRLLSLLYQFALFQKPKQCLLLETLILFMILNKKHTFLLLKSYMFILGGKYLKRKQSFIHLLSRIKSSTRSIKVSIFQVILLLTFILMITQTFLLLGGKGVRS